MDWAKFSFNYKLDSGYLLINIVHIEAYREAAMNLVLPPNWREQLDKLNRVRAVHGTTALEGNPLSEAEVAQQIETLEKAEQEAVNRMSKEQLQIRNSGLGQEWVKNRFYPGSRLLVVSDILDMHRMTTQHSDVTRFC